MSSAAYGITKADMEASRLVFVMLKGAQTQRKMAIPIMEGMSWSAFERQSGEEVQSLSALQDIDEVYVIEAPVVQAPPPAQDYSQPLVRQPSRPRPDFGTGAPAPRAAPLDENGHDKYAKRSRAGGWLARWLPWLARASSLPVTTRDAELGGSRRRRRKMSRDMRNLLTVVTVVLVMFVTSLLFMRTLHGSPGNAQPGMGALPPGVHAPSIRSQREQDQGAGG